MVLVGQVGRELVGLINRHGPYAVGLSGEDAGLFTASRREVVVDGESVDLGLVGDVTDVHPGGRPRHHRCRADPGDRHGRSGRGRPGAQRQRRLRCGLAGREPRSGEVGRADRRSRPVRGLAGHQLPRHGDQRHRTCRAAAHVGDRDGARRWRHACGRSRQGVPRAAVVDGRVAHSLLLEILTDAGFGTMVVPGLDRRVGGVMTTELSIVGLRARPQHRRRATRRR